MTGFITNSLLGSKMQEFENRSAFGNVFGT